MTDQQQRTQWALDVFASFVRMWTPPVAVEQVHISAASVDTAILQIAPKADNEPIGYGVFKREIDADWDIRQRPSGFVHELVSAVFDKPAHADHFTLKDNDIASTVMHWLDRQGYRSAKSAS
jgi:hypothetical protein